MANSTQLTPRLATFVKEYLKDSNAKRAAIAAGCPEKSAADTGCHWIHNNKFVVAEIAKARNALVAEGRYNLQNAMEEAKAAVDFAKETGNANAYVKAVELKAKLSGLLVEKHEVKQVGFHVNVGGIDFDKRDGTATTAPQAQKQVEEIIEGVVVPEDDGGDLFE